MPERKCSRCGSDTCPGQEALVDCTALVDGLSARAEAETLLRLGCLDAVRDAAVMAQHGPRRAVVHVRMDDHQRMHFEPGWPDADSERLRLARQTVIDAGYFTADEVGEDVAPRISEMLFAIRDGKWDVRGAFGRDPEEGAAPVGYLTPEEHRVMDMTADLANALYRLIDGTDEGLVSRDWNEAVLPLHAIQHTVLAQAAARAYPERYRLLGRTLTKIEED